MFRTEVSAKRKKVQLICKGKGRTKQEFKKECDIHTILDKMKRTGVMPEMREPVQANYGDFSDVIEYQEGLNVVVKAREAFDSLDAKTRGRFGNDPANMVAFCANDENYDEARKLGLLKPLPKNDDIIDKGTDAKGGSVVPVTSSEKGTLLKKDPKKEV